MGINYRPKCFKCGYVFPSRGNSREIGVPYEFCPRCNGVVHFDDTEEWDLKSGFGKLCYIGVCLWTVTVYSMIGLLAMAVCSEIFEFEPSEELYFKGWLGALIFFLIWQIVKLLLDIRKSRERLKDPKYVEVLKNLGII